MAIWGPAHVEDVAYLRVLIGQLRHKLNLHADIRDVIETESFLKCLDPNSRDCEGR